jgi:ribosomal protein L27
VVVNLTTPNAHGSVALAALKAGKNVREGKDNTLYAIKEGLVNFITKKIEKFDGAKKLVKVVNVE